MPGRCLRTKQVITGGGPDCSANTILYGEIKVGGVCVWGSREIAEAIYTDECCASVAERYSAVAKFFFFDTPVIVGNA